MTIRNYTEQELEEINEMERELGFRDNEILADKRDLLYGVNAALLWALCAALGFVAGWFMAVGTVVC